ncbi:unnamed protein product [Blepharisma stoltei]|uniref:Palmitoyltransferase n=1 Tax=Blepharisma stoltei TaxID=1481888 RepID=A0AAU9JWN8_9CILI|nr:unnamed protein product [Blepharisma stoltei]
MELRRIKTPVLMLLFDMTMLFALFFSSEYFADLESVDTISFWIISILKVFLYSLTSLKNPGFINYPITNTNLDKNNAKTIEQASQDFSIEVKECKKTFGNPTSGLSFIALNEENPQDLLAKPEKCLSTIQDSDRPKEPHNNGDQEINSYPQEIHEEEIETQRDRDNESIIKIEPSEDIIIVETRFCTVCNLEQPIRAKHCKECRRCVALHDHHCPWLGVCVGEKNRFYFYWYLVVQCIQLWWANIWNILSFESSSSVIYWLVENWLRLLLMIVLLFFTLMVTCLLGFHSYLALHNVTTWEIMSWSKISYLKNWPEGSQSPFSKGFVGNLYQYCCEKLPESYRVWEIPRIVKNKENI